MNNTRQKSCCPSEEFPVDSETPEATTAIEALYEEVDWAQLDFQNLRNSTKQLLLEEVNTVKALPINLKVVLREAPLPRMHFTCALGR